MTKRISVSEIIRMFTRESGAGYDQRAAAIGRRIHSEIEAEVMAGRVPSSLIQAGIGIPMAREKLYSATIEPDLTLSCRVDIVGEEMPIDIKTHERIMGRDLLQAAYEAIATESGQAAVYLHRSQTTVLIEDGGRSADEQLKLIARNTRTVLDNFARIQEIETTEKRSTGRIDPLFALHAEMQGREVPDLQQRGAKLDTEVVVLARQAAKLTAELDDAKAVAMEKIQRRGNLVVFR